MARATIVVDDAIASAHVALAALGDVLALPATAIDSASVHAADVLVIRSVTRVDAALLGDSRVSLVATATAGVDHVDTAELQRRGIAFVSAPGSNARAVAEYVLAALAELPSRWDGAVQGPVGVVGLGHVGRRVTALLRAFGLQVHACDPPLALRRSDAAVIDAVPHYETIARAEPLRPFDWLLRACPIITLHVPRVDAGPHATVHCVDAAALHALPQGAVVINTSRGGVVDEAALSDWLQEGRGAAILDVFEGEPLVREGVARAQLLTPHIAGYSLEGKLAATAAVVAAVADHLGLEAVWSASQALPPRSCAVLDACGDPIAALLRTHRGLGAVDAALRATLTLPLGERGAAFEGLRRRYPLPREHAGVRVPTDHPALRSVLAALGFAP